MNCSRCGRSANLVDTGEGHKLVCDHCLYEEATAYERIVAASPITFDAEPKDVLDSPLNEPTTVALALRMIRTGDAEWSEVEEVCRALLVQRATLRLLAGHIARRSSFAGPFLYPHADPANCPICQRATEIVSVET